MKDEGTTPTGIQHKVYGNLLVISDLDRIAINCEYRFARAAAAHAKGSADYWRAALDPDMLALDLPLAGAQDHLIQCSGTAGLCYLTSRPTECREKTVAFLSQHGYPCPEEAICRPLRKGLTTPRFKGLVVRALSYGLSPSFVNQHFRLATHGVTLFFLGLWNGLSRKRKDILFVDDSEKNRQVIAALGLAAYIATSLDEALAWLRVRSRER